MITRDYRVVAHFSEFHAQGLEVRVVVRRHRELGEYVCRVGAGLEGQDFKWREAADYFTDDRGDALGTAALMLRDYLL